MNRIEEFFKGLADLNRLRIINLLLNGELCGCDIQYVVGISQSNVSRHLLYLKKSGLVSDRRVGYRIYYRLVEDESPEYKGLIAYLHGALRDKTFVADTKKLRQAIKGGDCSVSEIKAGKGSLVGITLVPRVETAG
ncbi:MAG TPA: metalloregulator ArsR/SmtB family transcription factor [Candidatus Angelobacter sp.]|nr:metalloregulator ArsR/SmtB family transcription factor [Candidatus Angelobacter sp.]